MSSIQPACLSALLVKPLERVVLGEDGPVLEAAVLLVLGLLGVEAVELCLCVLARVEGPEEDIAGPARGQRGDPEPAEEVVAVGGGADAHLLQVLEREAGQVVVAQVGL